MQCTLRTQFNRQLAVSSQRPSAHSTPSQCCCCHVKSQTVQPCLQDQAQGQPRQRRQLLLSVLGTAALVQQQQQVLPARADEIKKLPKEYTELVKRIVSTLRESLQAEASGASEREVRRKADPAKEAVMEYVGKWQSNPLVSEDPSSEEIRKALAELGAFYKKSGSRSRLSDEVRGTVLGHLAAAEAALRQDLYRGSQKLAPSRGGSEGLLELI